MDLNDFAGQNWLITPVALAVGEHPPATIQMQKWLVVLTGVVNANLEGNSTSHWRNENLSFLPDMAGPNGSGPLNWAIGQYGIPKPAGEGYKIGLSVDEWAPFVSLSAIYDRAHSIDAGYAINVWRPNHFATGIDALTDTPVGNLFTGVNVDVGVRDTDAWILKLGYQITLRGRIVFTKIPTVLFQSNIETTAAGQAPSATQAVGTADFNGPNVIITPSFPHTGNWLQIGPLSQEGGQFISNFIQSSAGIGVYTLTAMMFMSSKSAESYLAFNSNSGENPSFLTLLFADNNQVQGGSQPTGCTFPRDTPFAIEVTLTISATSATAQVKVAGTAGSAAVLWRGPRFSSIAFAQQNPGGSGFDVTNVLVTYTSQ
jgi:hypothetical protein